MESVFLKNLWYMGAPSSAVKTGKMKSLVICNEPVLFFRDSQGQAHALRDICPHRGIPLSYGQIIDDQVECPYHGWKFDCSGTCTEIPSLGAGQDLDPNKIKVRSFPTLERYGVVWIFVGDKNASLEKYPPPPEFPGFVDEARPKIVEEVNFPCHLDHAVIGLMDPAHGPYVHKSWFWRSKKTMYEKTKKFVSVPHGFQMVRHQPSKNSKAYKILGGTPTTEITFSLPSVRVEHIKIGDYSVISLTALTPIDDKNTRVFQMLYWNLLRLSLLKPAIKKFAQIFLNQDCQAVTEQQDGLKYDPSLMLIKDADTQAKWYFQLKNEWINSQKESRPFSNPVKEVELRWRS
jgi:phenylpropionate dioxygenase-like ring-hydroxylating dioxygenase large terminal subunit